MWTTAIAEEDALADPLFDFQNKALGAGQLVALHRAADEPQLVARHPTLGPAAIAELSLFEAGSDREVARIKVESVALG